MTSTASTSRPVYEHPWAVRFCHWTNAVAITILTMSGLRIFNAFPSFGPKIPEHFLFGPKPAATGQYNPLQKLAYTTAVLLGTLSLLTGMVMYKPAQLSALGLVFGGYHGARLVHFLAMCGMLAFIPGHLVMVALHGWDNFRSMLTGWKQHPEYVPRGE